MSALARSTVKLEITNFSDAYRFAEIMAKSGFVPKDFAGKPDACLIAIQWGSELGLSPMQAVQNIAVINGRPNIWGDAALALVLSHPECLGVDEEVSGDGDARAGTCTVTRRNRKPVTRTFSVAQAKKAGLWGKQGPWTNYPDRMLQQRARGFALRDSFADALKGLITREEAEDYPEATEPKEVPNLAQQQEAEARFKEKLAMMEESLARCEDIGALIAYLGQPKLKEWMGRQERNHPEVYERVQEMIDATRRRLDPEYAQQEEAA